MEASTETARDQLGGGRRCLTCDYTIEYLSKARCPECGMPFDLSNPSTYYVGAPLSKLPRALMMPPGAFFHIATVLVFLMLMNDSSLPASLSPTAAGLGATGLSLLLFVVWLMRVVARAAIGARVQIPLYRSRATVRRWLFVPGMFVFCFLLCLANIPFHARLLISRPFMDHFAKACLALPPSAPLPQPAWIGLYPAVGIERCGYGISFAIPDTGFCCCVEFAYSPNEFPTDEYHPFTHASGPWYITDDK